MSTPTPTIPGVDRDALANAIVQNTRLDAWAAYDAAGAALAYIAAHHECACDREHAEWVEVDEGTWDGLPKGARRRREWVVGVFDGGRRFVHSDDLPDPDEAKVERMAKAIFENSLPNLRWESTGEDTKERYRKAARAALVAYREEER